MNTSDKIRMLYEHGVSVSDIAKVLEVKYQFVYNVVKEYVRSRTIDPD